MKNTKPLFFILFFFIYTQFSLAQVPVIEWQKTLGGTYQECPYAIKPTDDEGYIIVGMTTSNDQDVSGYHGTRPTTDAWVVKLDKNRAIEWQKCIGGSNNDELYSVQTITDGYILAGRTFSSDGDINPGSVHGGADAWIVKLDFNGNIVWQKFLGGSRWESADYIEETLEGGFVFVGSTNSFDGDVRGYNGNLDFWFVKLDTNGNILIQACFGGTENELPNFLLQTTDGGYIIGGNSESDNGDVTDNKGGTDAWILKLSENGVIQWERTYGGSGSDELSSIISTEDGDYIVVGSSDSNDGDVSGNHGDLDCWVLRFDKNGNIIWQNSIGGSDEDGASDIVKSRDNNFFVLGSTMSNNGDISGNHGNEDFLLLKIDNMGNIIWQRPIGGGWYESIPYRGSKLLLADGDGVVMVGHIFNNSGGEILTYHGSDDIWVAKLSPPSILPVKWINISATEKNGNIFLQWSTASEMNNKKFIIQRSKDAINFENIGEQVANVNTQETYSYSFTDVLGGMPFKGPVLYYRILQVDMDGRSTASKTVVVKLNYEARTTISVKNPVDKQISLNYIGTAKGVSSVVIVNSQGAVVFQKQVPVTNGLNVIEIPIPNLPNGYYWIIVNNDGKQDAAKFIKA